MQTEILPFVPEASCYICGSKEIVKVCHHCGRAMCAAHEPFIIPQSSLFKRIWNDEWDGIDLPEEADVETAVHCAFCLHYTKTYSPLLYIPIAIGIFFIMAAVSQTSIWHSVQSALLGTAYFIISAWGFILLEDYNLRQMRKDRSPVPFWGRFPSVQIVESAKAKIKLDSDGTYSVQVKNTSGTLITSLQVTASDEDRLYQYRQKYNLLDSEIKSFLAGFVVLHGTERLQTGNVTSLSDEHNPMLLKGSTAALRRLNRHHRQWQYAQKYAFAFDNQYSSGFPVQIVPSLLNEGDEWGLELYVQVNPDIDGLCLSRSKVEKLELETRGFSGDVETFMPAAKKTLDIAQNRQKVTWQNLMLKTTKSIVSKSFYVRFANSRRIKPDFIIEGRLIVTFEDAISGLQRVDLFSPFGQKVDKTDFRIVKSSKIIIDFKFDLAALFLRQFHSATDSIELLSVVPSNEMITRLVNALNDNNMYVQRVVENPQQMNWANAHVMERHWVIAGRRYFAATPVDFRIVAVGQEQYERSSDTPHDGKTKFEITAQGMVIKEEMQANIEWLRDNIMKVVPHTPELRIHSTDSKLYMNEWCHFKGIIKNLGKETLKNIVISAKGIKDYKIKRFEELMPDDSKQFVLPIYIESNGSVPVTIVAVCEDTFGKLPVYKERLQIQVQKKEKSKTPPIITNFNHPVSGTIHTGSGDNKIEYRDNHE